MRSKDKHRLYNVRMLLLYGTLYSMRKVIVLSTIILFSPLFFVFASLEISEIMYDLKSGSDDGREWVEIYNNSDEISDFSTYKFFEADTNHKLSVVQGSIKIEPYGYALIVSDFAKFKIDWPNLLSNIFDSTFSLSNSGEYLAIKNSEQVADSYFYNSSLGGAGNGKSLQKINGTWTSATPTPGSENKISYTPPPVQPKKETITLPAPLTEDKNSITEESFTPISLPPIPQSTDVSDSPEGNRDSRIFIVFFIGLLSFSAGSVYFLRKNRQIPENKDDFELLE